MAKIYNSIFEKTKLINFIKPNKNERVVYWRYTIFLIKINEKIHKNFKKDGIITRETYLPLHLHPIFRNKKEKIKFT